MIRKWFVNSISRNSNHRSRTGPFVAVQAASLFITEHRPKKDWYAVSITSKCQGG